MRQKPFDPFRYNADTVPPLVRKDLARIVLPELSPAELEPPPALKQRLTSRHHNRSVTEAAPKKRKSRSRRFRQVAQASILLIVTILAVVLARLHR